MKFYVSKWRIMTPNIRCYDFRFAFYEVLQNIHKTVLEWKYIVLFICCLFSYKKMCRIIYLQGKRYYDNWYPDFVNFCKILYF